MKKLLAILVALIMVFSLVACGGGGNGDGDGDSADKPFFGCLIRVFSDTYITSVRNAMDKYATEYGVEIEMVDANDSQATQNEQLESFLSRGVDGMIVQVVNVAAAEQILESCTEAGVPSVFFNHEPSDLTMIKESDSSVFIGTRSPDAGYMQADIFMELWDADTEKWDRNGDGVGQYVVFQGNLESQEAWDRSQFCVEGATDKGYEMEALADNFVCNWDAALAQDAATPFLAANLDSIEVFFCNNDSMAEGVVAALNAEGYNTGEEGAPEVMVIGVDATDAGIELINQGKMQGTVKQDGDAMAKAIVLMMISLSEGKTRDEALAANSYVLGEDGASVRIPYSKYPE